MPDFALPVPARPRKGRWNIALLLALGVIISFFDRINLSVSQDALHTAFGIGPIAFGYLSSSFSWTYGFMQIPAGLLLDRFGVRRVGRIAALLWSVASFLAAIAPTLPILFVARWLLGIAESPTFPANAKALGLWFPENERSLATALTDSAAKLSSAIGVPVLGVILLRCGWRWSFAATGAISLIYFFLFRRFYRDPDQDVSTTESVPAGIAAQQIASAESTAPRTSMLRYLLRQPKVYGLALGWSAYNYSFFLLLTWLPSYLSKSLHVDLLHSVIYTCVPWLFATFTDFLIGGWLVDALIQRGSDPIKVRRSVLIIGTSFGLAILGAAHPSSPTMALFWISLALGGLSAAAPVAWTVPALIAPRDSVGTLASIANFAGQISAISAPIVTGYIVSATHSFASAFIAATCILLLGVAGYALLLGRIERIPASSPTTI
jgi:MFS transporter, ACS family, D-galactonate transporter